MSVDTIACRFQRMPTKPELRALKASCGAMVQIRRRKQHPVTRRGRSYRTCLKLHQPTPETYQKLSSIGGKNLLFINHVAVAVDFTTKTAADAGELFQFMRNHMRKLWPSKHKGRAYKDTQYFSNCGKPGIHPVAYRRSGKGSDGKIRLAANGQPGCRVEFRVQGLESVVEALKIRHPADVPARWDRMMDVVCRHLVVERIDYEHLGKQFLGMTKAKAPLPEHPIYRANEFARIGKVVAWSFGNDWWDRRVVQVRNRLAKYAWFKAESAIQKVDFTDVFDRRIIMIGNTPIPPYCPTGVAPMK